MMKSITTNQKYIMAGAAAVAMGMAASYMYGQKNPGPNLLDTSPKDLWYGAAKQMKKTRHDMENDPRPK